MSVKIQINSLEALQRLLGGDPEFEIEVKRAVGIAFTRTTFGKTIENMVKQEFENILYDSLSKKISAHVRSQIKEAAVGILKTEAEKSLVTELKSKVSEKIVAQVGALEDAGFIKTETEKAIRDRVRLMVTKAMESFGPET